MLEERQLYYSPIIKAIITNFWLQRVIWPELMQRLGDLVGQVDKYMNRIVAKTSLGFYS